MYMRRTHFSKTERLEISVLLKRGYSHREIGRALGKHHSSVSREIERNSVKGIYDPAKAHHKARVRRQNSKYQGMKIRERPALEALVGARLESGWTPEQIAGRLKETHEGRTMVSAKGIYKWLYSAYGMPWRRYLPSKRNKPRKRKNKKKRKILIPNRIFIDDRPKEADRRIRVGDFEADTLGVPKSSKATLAGLVDRHSLYFLAVKIPRRGEAITGYGRLLSRTSVHSLTLDNGVEHAHYEILGVPTYFSHPYRAWEKPIIENTFQRLRRFIPKKARLDDYSEEQISAILKLMNNSPRKCLSYRTPEEVFQGTDIHFAHNGCCI